MPTHRSHRAHTAPLLALLVACAALCLTAAGSAAAGRVSRETPGPWCGGTFWRLMTLSDPQRNVVALHATRTTIGAIAKLATPKRVVPARTTAFQRRVWSVHAVVDRYRVASNGELVLILFSIDTGQYMDAYLPNPRCLGPRARNRTGMIAARNEFTSHCAAATPAWQLIGTTVDVAGVGFWNRSTATRGALRNGAELRPLTNLRVVSGCGVG